MSFDANIQPAKRRSSSAKRRSDSSSSTEDNTEACPLKPEPIDIGPALLLVVHFPGVGALLASMTLPYIFLVAGATENLSLVRGLTLANCIFGIFLALVLISYINITWQTNKRVARCQKTTFGGGSFLAMGFICAVVGAFHIWMIPLIYMKTL